MNWIRNQKAKKNKKKAKKKCTDIDNYNGIMMVKLLLFAVGTQLYPSLRKKNVLVILRRQTREKQNMNHNDGKKEVFMLFLKFKSMICTNNMNNGIEIVVGASLCFHSKNKK